MLRWVLFCALALSGFKAHAQFGWWNATHNWDGTTPWTQYLTYTHEYLGPNALPIPTLTTDNKNYWQSSSQISLRGDDRFITLHNEVQWVRGKTRFHITHQSIEAFQTTQEVRDARASRGESGRGVQAGDVLVDVATELWTNDWWTIHFNIHTKTAAGPLNQARFTDAPGYAFFFTGDWKKNQWWIRSELGFQVYQTFWTDYPQNDGVLANLAVRKQYEKHTFHAGVRSFTGYFEQVDQAPGDRAVLGELRYERQFRDQGVAQLGWVHGLSDYPFSYLNVGYRIWL